MLYYELTFPAFPENDLDSLPIQTTQLAAAKVYEAIRFEKQDPVVKMQSLLYKIAGTVAMVADYW